MSQNGLILEIVNLSKNFGGLTAVSDFNLSVRREEIVSIIGPNGAGKTTLFNLISQFYKPDSGDILLFTNSIKNLSPHQICGIGIARTFQTTRLFKHLSVAENLKVGMHTRTGYRFWDEILNTPKLENTERNIEKKALNLLDEFGLISFSDEMAGNLPYGVQRLVEILRSLNSSPQLLMLDEPAAGMNPQEAIHLMGVVEKIREKGITVLLVEHNMDVVMEISDRIVVLNYGKKIAEGSVDEIQRNPEVIAAYLGEDIEDNS
jgi:branched-chain amino acid transport system ATP-binding protein